MLNPEQRRRLVQAACRTCSLTGITRAAEWHRRSRGVTFLRLRFNPSGRDGSSEPWDETSLDEAFAVLTRRYRVISIDEAVAALAGERGLPESAVVLVVSLAVRVDRIDLPKLFARWQTPCVVYVSPGLLERGLCAWPLLVRHGLERVTAESVETHGRRWLLTSPEYRQAAVVGNISRLYELADVDRPARAEELVVSWGVDLDSLPGLRWYEVESLARSDLVTIGASGLTGESLVRLPLDRAIYEMREARALLADHLAAPARHFEYPWHDFSRPLREQLVRAGYVSALGADVASVRANARGLDLYALAAHVLRPATHEYLRAHLAGITDFLQPVARLVA